MLRIGWVMVSIALLVQPAGAASWLEQKLKEIDRSVCQSYQSIKCKAKGRKRQAPKPAEKKEAKASVPAEAEAAAPPPPKPRAKPEAKPETKPEAVTEIAKSPPPEAAPDIPTPRPKPVVAVVAAVETDAPLAIPRPRQKPAGLVKVVVAAVPANLPKPAVPPSASNCPAQLASLAVSFDLVTERVSAGGCTVSNPVKLKAQVVGGKRVEFPDGPTVNCAFAVKFAGWMKERGMPLAKQTSGSTVAKFYTGPGYQCRGRNGDGSAKISEHGYGNAIDIERMQLENGKMILVGSGDQRTVQALRKSACDYFTTVLGPGANSAHEKHLHFDRGRHGRSGTYMICE